VRLGQDFSAGGPVAVALVQGAIPRDRRWKASTAAGNLDHYLSLSAHAPHAEIVIWPELTMEFFPEADKALRARLVAVAQGGTSLLAGGVGMVRTEEGLRRANSVFLVDDGEVVSRYDKVRLVPFSETWPMLVRAPVGGDAFVAGRRLSPLAGRAGRIGVITCSEAMFPELVRERVRQGAEWLANPSNDDWFESRGAARQEVGAATMRAIETRRWIARATTTGYTTIIDAHGRVIAEAPFGTPEVLTGAVRASSIRTLYVRFGDWVVVVAVVVLVGDLLARARR
jgi:apolipoprotein N-acyltransferase